MKTWELLSSEEKWAKGDYSFNKNGSYVDPEDPDACGWCVIGALCKCYPEGYKKPHDKIKQYLKVESIARWNDDPSTTYDDVIKVLKKLDV